MPEIGHGTAEKNKIATGLRATKQRHLMRDAKLAPIGAKQDSTRCNLKDDPLSPEAVAHAIEEFGKQVRFDLAILSGDIAKMIESQNFFPAQRRIEANLVREFVLAR